MDLMKEYEEKEGTVEIKEMTQRKFEAMNAALEKITREQPKAPGPVQSYPPPVLERLAYVTADCAQ
jgi:hypothetical protein